MIAAFHWRADDFGHVLLVGSEPVAEVRRVPGKPTFSCTLQTGTGLGRHQFATLEAAKAHAEALADAVLRQRLSRDAQAILSAAGL